MPLENHLLDSKAPVRECPACGQRARRANARYCSACGHFLDESYLPADALRASYNLEQRRRTASRSEGRASGMPLKSSMSSIFPERNYNGASTTAMAFVTYALVPYLGILFTPGAVLMGGVGLYNSYRVPERGGRRASYLGLSLGLLIFCAQLFLWWILYKIPEWTGR
ncbi:MAG TPA: hypothetical protein VF766_04680 [Pyrinomonadaceae bacterium]